MAQWAAEISLLALGVAALCAVQLARLKRFTGYQMPTWKERRAMQATYNSKKMPEKNPDKLSDDIVVDMRQFSSFVSYLEEFESPDWLDLDRWNFQDTGVLRDFGTSYGAFRTIEIRHNNLVIGRIEVIRPSTKDKELWISFSLVGARRFSGSKIFGIARRLAYIVQPEGADLASLEKVIYHKMILGTWRVAGSDGELFIGNFLKQSISFDFCGTVDHWLECKERYEQIKCKWSPPLETLHHSP